MSIKVRIYRIYFDCDECEQYFDCATCKKEQNEGVGHDLDNQRLLSIEHFSYNKSKVSYYQQFRYIVEDHFLNENSFLDKDRKDYEKGVVYYRIVVKKGDELLFCSDDDQKFVDYIGSVDFEAGKVGELKKPFPLKNDDYEDDE